MFTVPIFFYSEIGEVMPFTTTLVFVFPFLSTVSLVPYLATASILVINAFLISFKPPLDFITFSLGVSDLSDNRPIILDDMTLALNILHPVNPIISSIF